MHYFKLPSFYCKVLLLTKFTMHTIHVPNNTSTQKVQTRIRFDGQMKAHRLQEGNGIPKVSVTLGQTHQEQLPLKSSFINYQRIVIQMSSRKAAKSFASLVTADWQLKERMGGVCAPFHNLDLLWDQNSTVLVQPPLY